MSVTNQTPVNAFTANGVTTVFNFTFQLLDSTDLWVQVDGVDKTLGSDYTVSGVGNPSGGSVTFVSAPTNLSSVVVFRESMLERDTDYQNNGDLRSATINNDFDRIWLALQEILYGINLAPTLRPGSPLSGTINLPDPGAGMFLRWNLAGNALEAVDGTGTAPGEFIQSGIGAVARSLQSKIGEFVSVKDFGAVGNGSTDDTISLQKAIDAVNSSGGGIVFVPRGLYQTTGITLKDGVTLKGEGAWASILRTTHATQSIVTMKTSAVLSDLKLLSSVTRTSGYYVDCQGNGAIIDNCEFGGYFIGVNVGVLGGSIIVGTTIKDCELRDPVTTLGAGAIQFINFSNAEVRNSIITGNAGQQASFGIRYQNGDTAFLSDTNITLHGKALLVDTGAGYNIYALTITGCVFDSAGTIAGGTTVSSAEIIPAGGVWNTRISNTWFGLSVAKMGCYVAPSGGGVVDGITFTGCEFTDNGDCGLIVIGTGVKNWIVTGGHSGGNTNSGIRVAGGSTHFLITGHRAGNIAARGANNTGITIDAAASDYYVIEGCNLIGNTTNALVDGGTGANVTVVNNLGYNGVASVAGVSVGASPWSYTAGHTPETMYFAGGTLSEIRVDGTIVQNTTAATIQLLPNQVMQVTYTVAPNVMRKRN